MTGMMPTSQPGWDEREKSALHGGKNPGSSVGTPPKRREAGGNSPLPGNARVKQPGKSSLLPGHRHGAVRGQEVTLIHILNPDENQVCN